MCRDEEMDLALTMAEETHLGFQLKSLQQQEHAALSVLPSTNQHNLTLQAILQRLHAAQVRGFPPDCPWDVCNIVYCASAAQPVQLRKYASYASAPHMLTFVDPSPRLLPIAAGARRRLTQANLHLVLKVVLAYSQQKQVDMQDLVQAGMYGLGRGLDKYDPSRGSRVSTVAYMWVKEAVGRVYNESARTIIISERTLTNVGLSHDPTCPPSANAFPACNC